MSVAALRVMKQPPRAQAQTHRVSVRVLLVRHALLSDASLPLPPPNGRVDHNKPTKEERTRKAADPRKILIECGRCSIFTDYGNCILPKQRQLNGPSTVCQRSWKRLYGDRASLLVSDIKHLADRIGVGVEQGVERVILTVSPEGKSHSKD